MFGRRFHLFTIFGFAVGIDTSWVFLAIIVTWSLATGAFPVWYPDLAPVIYWWMGVAGALGLFASIVVHELAHSVVARHHGVVMKGITLFIFGGVAEMTEEPPSPKAEFQVAIAGPIMSVIVSMSAYLLHNIMASLGASTALVGVLKYMWFINGILVLFNLIPAFPLDGGRVLRSVLWRSRNDLVWATKITSNIGVGFSFFLVGAGVLSAIQGNLIGGIWYFLIGMFLRGAANMSYRQQLIRRSLEGETVQRFMRTEPVTVPPQITIESLVADYVYQHHHKMYPVVDGDRLVGCISTREVKSIGQDEWPLRSVGDLTEPCSEENTIAPEVDATRALARMSQSGRSRLMVVDNGRLLGVVTLKDLLQFLALKVELEER